MDVKFGEFVGSPNRLFIVPAYQRAYSWGEDQWRQFVDDLKEAQGEYYLGHFLIEVLPPSDGFQVYGLIDGQQRITTSVIFMKAAIDVLAGEEDRRIEALRYRLGTTYIRQDDYSPYRFRTVDYDNENFVRYVLEGNEQKVAGQTKSEDAFVKALNYFRKRLKAMENKQVVFDLAVRLNTALITEYEVKNHAMAAQIFSFQNDRGKDLSKLEVLKAYFLLQIYQDGRSTRAIQDSITETVRQSFAGIYHAITQMDVSEDAILAAYWRSRVGFYNGDVVSSVKNAMRIEADKAAWIKTFARELSDAFIAIRNFRNDVRDIPMRLRVLGQMEIVYPFVIRLSLLNVGKDESMRLLRVIENLVFRVRLCSRRAAVDTPERLGRILISFCETGDVCVAIDGIKRGIREWGYWNDADMRGKLDQNDFYHNAVVEYLFWQYERDLRPWGYAAPSDMRTEIVRPSIEHIAPQTATHDDPLAAGYGAYENIENKDKGIVTGGWMNALGNLVLLSLTHNIKVSNHPFAEKISEYESLGLLRQQMEIKDFATRPIDGGCVWDVDAIARRHAHILGWAMRYWNIDSI